MLVEVPCQYVYKALCPTCSQIQKPVQDRYSLHFITMVPFHTGNGARHNMLFEYVPRFFSMDDRARSGETGGRQR